MTVSTSTIQLRGGTAAQAAAHNEILAAREIGVETDTGRFKVGDGVTAWNALPYNPATWADIIGKPAYMAVGASASEARAAIGASNLTLGTTGSTAKPGNYAPTLAEVTAALGFTPENAAGKNQPSGYCGLGSDGLVPSVLLPSYVDDIVEISTLSAAPNPGETGKIYVARDTNKIYRYSGSTYIEVSPSPGSTDSVAEGSVNLYYTNARAQAALASALAGKESTITAGTTGQYWRGDKSWTTLNKSAVGLSAADNTSDTDKPISTATQAALDALSSSVTGSLAGKQSVLTSTPVKTSAYTAAANELIPVDATGGSVTVTLPSGAASGTRFVVKKVDTTTNQITLSCQGSERFNTSGGSSTRTLTLPNEAAMVQYNATLGVWYVISTDLPLSQTDLRYLGITATATAAQRLSTPRLISGVSFDGSADINPVTAATVGPAWFPAGYISGNYYYTNSAQATNTSNNLGTGTVRVSPWIVTQSVTVTRLFAEFSAAGDSNSVYRIGIWNHDTSTGKPSTLLLDAGSISTGSGNAGTTASGGTPGVYEVQINGGTGVALSPGMYWVGGAVQGVTTTQPTMRVGQNYTYPLTVPLGTSLPSANATIFGWLLTGQTGSFGSLTSAITASGTSNAARIGFKVA